MLKAVVASERRRGADYVRMVIAASVIAADPAEALTPAWGALPRGGRR